MSYLTHTNGKALEQHRNKILDLEAFLKELPQEEIPVKHTFGGGVYMREITIPAGLVCTGVIHRYETMNVLVSGRIRMLTPDGPKEIEGPMTFTTPAGSKNAGLALTDVTWINIFVTDKTDVDEIEKEMWVEDFETLALENLE
jgi:hypothetical protein